MKYTIDVVTRLQDCGDGGYTMYVYNNQEEMLADFGGELTEERIKKILTEDDPYRNGYLGKETIKVEIVNGKAILSEALSFHVGQ